MWFGEWRCSAVICDRLEHADELLGDRRVGEGTHPGDLRSLARQGGRDLLGLVVVRGCHFGVLGGGGCVVGKGWHRERRVFRWDEVRRYRIL